MSLPRGNTAGGHTFPIALVGLACRFPGADDVAEFWSLLKTGKDAVTEIPEDRWDVDAHYDPDPAKPGKMYTRAGGFIANIDKFDAGFFGISPREARRIDPQHRLLLELTWDAFESAGIVPARIGESPTGVFVGISLSDYAALQREEPAQVDSYVMSGSAISNAANRISYVFNLRGPSLAVDTACSSSLVAVHEACVSLWTGESTLAIAAGVNALLSPSGAVGFSKAHMLSPTGRCHPFDAAGDGYVRSEGAAVVILQPLAQAIAERNPVHAVIIGSGVNSDGRTTGLAMPNQAAQEALLRRVYRDAGIDPSEIAYVEAHGTGTSVGDPIECGALGAVLGLSRAPGDYCRIGSVKSNIGHLEPASGIAGLLKVVLALRHRAIPRTLHFTVPNPKIPFEDLNLSVVSEHTKLPHGRVTMGVNSFGFGGTNAHIVVREPDTPADVAGRRDADSEGREVEPLLISAHNSEALKSLAMCYAELLRSPTAPPLSALCHGAATRRTHHQHRLAAFGRTRDEVAAHLESFAAGDPSPLLGHGHVQAPPVRLAMVFSGNGSQWDGMGQDLLADPFIAESIERIDATLSRFSGWSVKDALLKAASAKLFDRTEIAQPALFALQVGMLEWLRAHGVEAEAMLGHSVGEVSAAYGAGILSLAEACRVIVERSRAQGPTAGTGRMAALGLSPENAATMIAPYDGALTIAAVNAPNSVTLAGDAAAIEALGGELQGDQVFFRPLDLDYAFHSRFMDPIREGLLDRLAGLQPQNGRLRFVSTVTGTTIEGNRLDAGYWWENIRRPVQFAAAVESLRAEGFNVFLEIGPHAILDRYLRDCLQAAGGAGISIATLRRREPERDALWLALGRCYAAGVAIDYDVLYPRDDAPVPLPSYPWQRERYWFAEDEGVGTSRSRRKHPLLGKRLLAIDGIWKNRLDPAQLGWLADHAVQKSMVLPGTAYIEMAVAAVLSTRDCDGVEIEGFEIRRPLVIATGAEPSVETALSAEDGAFRLHASETLGTALRPVAVARALPLAGGRSKRVAPVEEIRARMGKRIDGAELYRRFAARGLIYGPAFRGVAEAWAGKDEALGRIAVPAAVEHELREYRIHPALLDACFQVTLATIPEQQDETGQVVFVPSKAERIRFHDGGEHIAWCHVTRLHVGPRSIVVRVLALARDGAVIAEVDGLRLHRVDLEGIGEIPAYRWKYEPKPRADADDADLPRPQTLAPLFGAANTGEAEHDAATRALLDRVAAAYAGEALAQVAGGSRRFSVAQLIAERAVAPEQEPHLDKVLAIARQAGVAVQDGSEWRLVGSSDAAETLWRQAIVRYPAHLASLQLIARHAAAIPGILQSGRDAPDLLSAEPGFDAIEQLYDCDPIFHRTNEAAAGMVRRLFHTMPRTRSLRIIEIRGGTGGLAGALLSAVPAGRVEYVFTDPSEAAVSRAEARFKGLSFVRCAVLDPEKETAEQGFARDEYDLVVATAPPAAQPDIGRDLAATRLLLKPGGLLLLIVPKECGFLDLTCGMIGGDASEGDWQQLLRNAGFADVVSPGWDSPVAARAAVVARKPAAPDRPPVSRDVDPVTWLVLADDTVADPAAAVVAALTPVGRRVVIAQSARRFDRLGLDRFAVPPGDASAYAQLFRLLAADGVGPLHLVHLRGAAEAVPADPLTAQQASSFDLLIAVQALINAGLAPAARLTIVTSGAMPMPEGAGGCARPWQAPIWGLTRTIRNERADIASRLIDVDPATSAAGTAAALVAEILHPDDEDEVLLRGDARYVPRLTRWTASPALHGDTPETGFTLTFAPGKAQDGAVLQRIAIPLPAAGEVAVRVRAAGVNFRDVLQRMGLLPEEAFEGGFAGATLGMEFAGEVTAVGDGVDRFRPGDAVFGFGRGAFSSHLAAPAFGLFKKPGSMSFEEAATLPVAVMTVYYSLHHLARLQKGERILVQGAAGGVGLAAVQYAQSVGAEIFASAGSVEKREFLRRLGVPHVVDSRSLAFADDIREITEGEGVDVVLNSIAGEAIHKGLSILRPYGRFIELGKRDFFANSKIGLQPFRNNVQFFGVDVDRLLIDRPALCGQLFDELASLFEQRVFVPLPYRVFPITRAAEAFRCMQHSRHIGKIVLAIDAGDRPPIVADRPDARMQLSPMASYLVTGGRGGFGLATAEWLARKGARHLAVVGRSEETAPDAAMAIERLRQDGIAVREFTADIADADHVAELLRCMRREMPPLSGIIHCAAVIQDSSLANMTEANFHDVSRPKIAGAWNLHQQTLDQKLDFFVMYSSATTLFGNEGQGSYVAANLYLEALADYRRGLGLPGLAVAWGAIGEVGHLARNPGVARLLGERLGVKLLAPAAAFDWLEQAILSAVSQVAPAELSWSRLAILPGIANAPKFARVRESANDAMNESKGQDTEEVREHLAGLPRNEAISFAEQLLIKHVAGIVGITPAKLAANQSLLDLGMDSLMLVELQMALEKQCGIAVSTLELMETTTVAKLAQRIVDHVGSAPAIAPSLPAATAAADPDEREPSAEPAIIAAMGQLLKDDLDRAKGRAF
jgi:acyl transferase domain-containing protein/NADPH:quinone reductase-like Zn-dependent oxidoreductase/acyl carrier protein/SAM-dependent methyltransferase